MRGEDDRRRTYVLEVYCDRTGKPTTAARKIAPYVALGLSNALDDALKLAANEPAARVLVVCDTAQMRDALIRALPQREGMPDTGSATWGRFRFKAADELQDFGGDWLTISGERVPLPAGTRQSP